MARRKATEEVVEKAVDAEVPEVNEVEAAETPEKDEEAVVETPEVEVAQKDIPEYALDVLKAFYQYPELLITPQGGAFVPSKHSTVEGAILYKNPFYNK